MISIIMPVLNEAAILGMALETLLGQYGDYEVIVVDGASKDDTCLVAQRFPVQLVRNPPGRSKGIGDQINQGANQAHGQVLMFLHADVRLPPQAIRCIEAALANPNVIGGGFLPTFEPLASQSKSKPRTLAWVESVWRLRTRLFGWFAGDTAPFIRTGIFKRNGGYPMASFASDWDFASQLRRLGQLVVIREPVGVNSRRHIYNGVLKTLLVTGSVELMYHLGADRTFLREWYRRWLPRERESTPITAGKGRLFHDV